MARAASVSGLWAALKEYEKETVTSVTARQKGFVKSYYRWFGERIFTCKDVFGQKIPEDVKDQMGMTNDDAADIHMLIAALPTNGLLKHSSDRWAFCVTPRGRDLAIEVGEEPIKNLNEGA